MLLISVLEEGCYPERAHFTDAGIDLKASEAKVLDVGEVYPMSVGIKVEIPAGYVGMIFPRSGLGSKKGVVLANTVGIIDSDYRGEIICSLKNAGSFEYRIEQYERIAQLVIVPCMIGDFFVVEENELSDTSRGEGGFGHTGT